MIDMHSHILHGIDDGAQAPEDSLAMAEAAIADGISTIVATPHHKNGAFDNYKSDIESYVANLNILFKAHDIALTVLPGQEVRVYGEILDDIANDEILTVNHSKYIMIEFPTSSVPRYANKLFYDIQLAGYTPVIVHPERNQVLLADHGKMYEFVRNGALTQITAGSVIGKFGKEVQEFTHQLIAANLTHLVATDAHNITTRGFNLQEAYAEISKKFGVDTHYMFIENAHLLIDDMNLNRFEPSMIKKKKKFLGLF